MSIHRAAAFTAVAVCLGAWSAAGTIESVRSGASERFERLAPGAAALEAAPAPEAPQGAPADRGQHVAGCRTPGIIPGLTLERPRVEEFIPPAGLGPLVGSFVMAERLDSHRDMATKQFGAQVWDASIAGDAAFKIVYATFAQKDKLVLRKIENPNDLRGKGVVVSIDAQTHYRFKVSINIFNPVRGSTLKMDPVNGTRGPAHRMSTGELLDRIKAESYVFHTGGKEYWTLYGTDVDPKTDQLADTRSLIFINEAGTNSMAWPLAESQLEPDKPVAVALGDNWITLVRTSDGKLKIHGGRSSAPAAAK